jgi:hypothetical protein
MLWPFLALTTHCALEEDTLASWVIIITQCFLKCRAYAHRLTIGWARLKSS